MKQEPLQGEWTRNGDKGRCGIFQAGRVLMLADPEGHVSVGHLTSPNAISVVNAGAFPAGTTGKVTGVPARWVITWSNGESWSTQAPAQPSN